jgi:hypothetical protein
VTFAEILPERRWQAHGSRFVARCNGCFLQSGMSELYKESLSFSPALLAAWWDFECNAKILMGMIMLPIQRNSVAAYVTRSGTRVDTELR